MNAVEKFQEPAQKKMVEQWLREDVVKAYDESVANPSLGTPLKESWAEAKAKFKAKYGA